MEETLAELHPDCPFEDLPLGKTYRGRAGAEAYYRLWWDAFNLEVKGERRHWSEGGAFMIAQTRYQGAHRGRFVDYAPTGRPISFPLAVVIPFRDGLMAGERFYYDLATLLRQIGVLPAMLLAQDNAGSGFRGSGSTGPARPSSHSVRQTDVVLG